MSDSKIPAVIPLSQIVMQEDGTAKSIKVKPLTYALMTWVKRYKELEDTIDIAADENSAQWEITYEDSNDRDLAVYINTYEEHGFIVLSIYYRDEEVALDKVSDAKLVISAENFDVPTGHFELVQDNKVLRYKAGISVRNIASPDPQYSGPHLISPQLIDNMFEDGISAMNNFLDDFSKVAFDL